MGCKRLKNQKFSFLEIVPSKKRVCGEEKRINYYPFGMPMPNRNLTGSEQYRYAFQGQEKDPETGKEAFQLRLWDGRIGRWLTTDPYGQYNSPYVGMGNDPINGIDPDGGYKTKWGRFWGWAGNGFKGSFTGSGNASDPQMNYGIKMNYTPEGGGAGISVSFSNDALTRNTMLSDMSNYRNPDPSSYTQSNILSNTSLVAGMTIGNANRFTQSIVASNKMVNYKLDFYNLYRSNGALNGNQHISGSKFLGRVKTIKTVANYASALNYIGLFDGYGQSFAQKDQRYLVRGTFSYIVGTIPYLGAAYAHGVDNSSLKYYHLSHYVPSLYNNPFKQNSLVEGMLKQ